jgi:hypothetical protein
MFAWVYCLKAVFRLQGRERQTELGGVSEYKWQRSKYEKAKAARICMTQRQRMREKGERERERERERESSLKSYGGPTVRVWK